ARRAGLRRWVPAVDSYDRPAVPLGLVFQHRPEPGPARAADQLGQAMVAGHSGHVEILDGDTVETSHEVNAGLVQEVPPGVGDPGVLPGDLPPGLHAVGGSFLAAGQAPLVALQ